MSPLLQLCLTVSWRMTAVIAAWLLLRVVLRNRIPTRFLVAGWALILGGLLLPVRLPTPASPFNLMPHPVQTVASEDDFGASEVADSYSAPVTSAPSVPMAIRANPGTGRPTAIAASTAPKLREARQTPSISWTYLWAAGAAFFLLLRGWRWIEIRRMLARSRPVVDTELSLVITHSARGLGISSRVRVFEIETSDAPAVLGLIRPTLVFPKNFAASLSPAELQLVVQHELGHWRRHDLWLHEFAHFVRAIHWFNPAVWLATTLLQDDSESACDEFVLRRMAATETHAYGATLLKVVRLVSGRPASRVGLGIFGSKQKLQHRIIMIARYHRLSAWRSLLGAFAIITLLAVCLTQEVRAQNSPAPTPAPNPTGRITTEAPPGWKRNGKNQENYTVGVDFTQPYSHPGSAYAKSIGASKDGDFGGMMQVIDAAPYIGKRLRFSAWMRTQEAKLGAQLWMRIDGDRQSSLRFDNMDMRPHPMGTTGWQHCEVVLDVPAESSGIFFGFFIKSEGQAWVNDAKLEEVGPDVPVTDMKLARKQYDKPQNLDFTPAP